METTKKQLISLILKLSFQDYAAFKDNYSIKGSRELLEFIKDLDKETAEEVVNEINFNTEIEY
tara:strand:+ start:1160 stop:1348 length:189 start_codon:yes stop_codon:yes gene_type:complete